MRGERVSGGSRWACGAALCLGALFGGASAHAQSAPPAPNSANGNPPAEQQAAQSAIPLTPDEIQALANRYNATKQAEEQAVTPMAVPLSRQVNVSFAPGAAVSIINTVKGYPTAVSFFDSTGAPWPIQWDTNSDPAAVSGSQSCNAPRSQGGPSVVAIGFFVCTPTKG